MPEDDFKFVARCIALHCAAQQPDSHFVGTTSGGSGMGLEQLTQDPEQTIERAKVFERFLLEAAPKSAKE